MAEGRIYHASHRWARIAPRKARLIADLVRGLPVNDALAILESHPRRSAKLFHKVVKSALANASTDMEVDLNALVVHQARADMGPLLGGRGRWRPRAMGRATPIRKRTSHLLIELSEAAELRSRRRGGRRKAAPQAEPGAAPAAAGVSGEAGGVSGEAGN